VFIMVWHTIPFICSMQSHLHHLLRVFFECKALHTLFADIRRRRHRRLAPGRPHLVRQGLGGNTTADNKSAPKDLEADPEKLNNKNIMMIQTNNT